MEERRLDALSSSRELIASTDLVVLSVTRASIYNTEMDTDTNSSKIMTTMTSNPVRVLYKCKNDSTIARFVLQSFSNNEYDEITSINSTIFTKCSYGEQSQHKYTCAYTDGSTYNIKVRCDGWTNNVLKTTCPNRKRTPECSVLTTNGHCTLNSYSNSMVECICDICTSTQNRRLLNVKTVATQVSAITSYVFDEYASTMSEADSLTWQDIKRAIIIIISFVVVWSVVILIVPFKARLHKTVDHSKKHIIRLSRRFSLKRINLAPIIPENNDNSDTMSVSPQKRLKTYIDMFFPVIFRDDDHSSKLFRQLSRKILLTLLTLLS